MLCSVASSFKAYRIDRGVNFRNADNRCDQFLKLFAPREIDWFESY